MSYETRAYLMALGLTLACELPIVVAGYWRRVQPRWGVPAVFLVANCFTHGLLWTVWALLPGSYVVRLLSAETVVVLIEAVAFRLLLGGSWRRALLVSLVANAVSTAIGLLALP